MRLVRRGEVWPRRTPQEYNPDVHDQPLVETELEALVAACIEAEARGDVTGVEGLLSRRPDLQAAARAQLADLRRTGLLDEQPEQIGNYRVIARLGSGGMGTVYLAEQLEPVQRHVALKLVRPGLQTRDVVGRFALERQSLAMMQHANVAGVFDAGVTADGRPYFVMEYVDGLPITDHADLHRLTTEARLRLFLQACEGVQHAHLRGVIHRDLKPSNILVAEADGKPVPKIIDFGIAKVIDQRLSSMAQRTEHGMLLGTPEYMSPEQADGDADGVDLRTDVYSLGVVLYELLTGTLPFPSDRLRTSHAEMRRILREEPATTPSRRVAQATAAHVAARQTSVTSLQRTLHGELDWIVLKAMEKEPDRRYESANGLAQDLARHLAHEPVLAGPASTGYRLRKLARRYRGVVIATAIVLVALLAGGIGTFLQYLRAENKVHEFDQLAGVVVYERTVAAEQELYPSWPHKTEAMLGWLRDCDRLLAMRPAIERTIADLRARSLPQTEAEKQRDRETHPRFAEWQRLVQRLASLRRAQAIRTGAPLVVPELSVDQQALDWSALNTHAWGRIAPKPAERETYGEEAFGLACARAAVAKASDADRHQPLDTLAWALLANGQDADARAQSAAALAAAPAEQESAYEGYQRDVGQAIANAAKILADVETEQATLAAEVAGRRAWKFADDAPRFLHDTLSELLGKLVRLENNEKAAVELRLHWAQQIEAVSINAHRARWERARAAIAASGRYRSPPIDLRPQMGLVPIGENPVTGLWEFYDLRSVRDGASDPAAIVIPQHDAEGNIPVSGETGIVFVLLPGGTFTMGSQAKDPDGPNYDEQAVGDEALFTVELAPFFLARHELSQGQWRRLTGADPSFYKVASTPGGVAVTTANPVEQISWLDCELWLARYGFVLPTEAQWEYGCRAGTTTPWSCAFDELRLHANVGDATAKLAVPSWTCETWSDGHAAHAPVGTFRANGFGLFDTHGNVWEWTRDGQFPNAAPRSGDGLRGDPASSAARVARGGSYYYPAHGARSAGRDTSNAVIRDSNLGVRVARDIQP